MSQDNQVVEIVVDQEVRLSSQNIIWRLISKQISTFNSQRQTTVTPIQPLEMM